MQKEWETAIRHGDLDQVRTLMAAGMDINSKDRYGQTGLMVASIRGHTEVVRSLIDHGAELNVTAKFHLSALMLAVINGHTEIVRLLAGAAADRDLRGSGAPGFFGKTALALAESAGREEIAAILKT